jgi:GNAT superfamily N-acetyltransferase
MSTPRDESGSILIVGAPYGSDLYRRALVLREAILRAPLGLALTAQEQADDARRQHFCAVFRGEVVGSVSFEPLDSETAQLRQMAVAADRRLERIGSRLLAHGEDWAYEEGYRLIVMPSSRPSSTSLFRSHPTKRARSAKPMACGWRRVCTAKNIWASSDPPS